MHTELARERERESATRKRDVINNKRVNGSRRTFHENKLLLFRDFIFHHWPRFSLLSFFAWLLPSPPPPSSDCLIALLCCPGTQTLRRLSRSSSIGELRKTLTHPATQLSRNNITRRRRLPWAITRNPFILHDALMLRLPTWLTLGRGHPRLETMARA